MTRSPVKNDKTRRKGLFDDGLWKCDCDPRLAAKKIRVQKDNENHGKWCKWIPESLMWSQHLWAFFYSLMLNIDQALICPSWMTG